MFTSTTPPDRLVDQPSPAPTRKVTAAGVGGATSAIVIWVLAEAFGVDAPPGIEAAIATIVGAGLAYVVRERA